MQNSKHQQSKPEEKKIKVENHKPNEKGGFYFSSSLKITDPDTGKVIVQMRCD